MMKVYDEVIQTGSALLGEKPARPLPICPGYPLEKEKVFVFPEDSILDLGGSNLPSPYLMAYTSSSRLVKEDAVYLIGEDIPNLKGPVPYAHISFLRFEEEEASKEQELYRLLRNIEYQRYKLYPEGCLIRVNTNRMREGVLVGKDAFIKGMDFAKLGSLFMDAYKKEKRVRAVVQYFITDPSFPFDKLESLAKRSEGITVALDHIMKKLAMDCSTCEFKGICDEIEGMREVHKKEAQ